MRNNFFNTFLALLLSVTGLIANAQDNFYPATITYEDGKTEQVFFKTKSKIVEENKVNVYKTSTNSSLVTLGANDFKKIESSDGQLVFLSKKINGLGNDSKLILKQLLKGEASLFISQINSTIRYVIQKENEFYLMKSSSSQSGFLYNKWLYNNLNKNSLSPNDYMSLSLRKNDLIQYLEQENTTSQVLTGEQKVPFFNLSAIAGLGYYNYSFAENSPNFDLNNALTLNYQVGLRVMLNMQPVEDRSSIFVDLKYSSASNNRAEAVLFPLSNIQRRTAIHDFNFSLLHLDIGFQRNYHIRSSTLSPYVKFGLGEYINASSTFRDDDSVISEQDVEPQDAVLNLGVGVNYYFDDKFSLALGYDFGLENDIRFSGRRVDTSWNGFSLHLVYNIFRK